MTAKGVNNVLKQRSQTNSFVKVLSQQICASC